MCSWFIAVNNGDSLQPLHLLIAACFPSKAFTIHKLPIEHATISGVLYVWRLLPIIREAQLEVNSISIIANKVTVYEVAPDDLCIHISEDMYLALAKRLYTDIQSVNLFDVFINKSLKHGPFLDVFVEMLKTKPFDEFKSLILGKCQNIRHFANSTFSVNKSITETIDILHLCECKDHQVKLRIL
jgi:hypothetical protein